MPGPESDRPDVGERNATFCATFVDELARAGVTDAVVCPGSRSTPMALALAADERVRVHVHHDERAGAFVALGLGLASGRPAVVLTTSGTAAVELHPAVVEAHHARVPLLALTADRPVELRGVGAPQTIDQTRLFGTAVRWFVEASPPDGSDPASWRSLAARAVLEASGTGGAPPGPVQVDLPFREPLVGEPGPLPGGRPAGRPWLRRPGADGAPCGADVDALAAAVAGRRVLVVAGGAVGDPAAVLAACEGLRWPVVADPRSGCRVPGEQVVAHADAVLRHPPRARDLRPEVVLRLGAPPASKVLARWLAGLDAWQVGVDARGSVFDPDGVLDSLVVAEPGALLAALAGAVDQVAPDGWLRAWATADASAASAIGEALAGREGATEPGVARNVLAALPDGASLVVSSSMPVRGPRVVRRPPGGRDRAGQPWGQRHRRRGVDRGGRGPGHRGADGGAGGRRGPAARRERAAGGGAAAGGPDGGGRRTTGGGGIFSFLPQATALDDARFEQLFGTPHEVELAPLAAAHGLLTLEAHDDDGVAQAVQASVVAGGVRLVVARTDRAENVAVHDELHAAVAAALAAG